MRIPAMTFVVILMSGFAADHARAQVRVGAEPRCALTQWDAKSGKWKEVWAGVVPREYLAKHQPWSLIAWPGGSLDISSKDWNGLKAHDGRTTVHLLAFGGQVQISIGHIDSSNAKNQVPTDAMAWASDDAKEVGLGAFQKKLTCRLRGPAGDGAN